MSEQPKDQNALKQGETAKLDAAAASAALALAVTSAEKSSAQPPKADANKGPSGMQKAQALLKMGQPLLQKVQVLGCSVTRHHLAQAAAVALAVALGWAGGSQTLSGARQAHAEAATGSGIRQNQEDTVRLTGEVQALKSVVESVKDSFEQAKTDAAAHNRSLVERLEAVERAGQDAVAKIVRVAEATERMERAGAAAEAKLAAINSRVEPLEQQAPAVKPAPTVGADPAQTGSVPDAQALKNAPIEGWVLREVYNGGAVVESRSGRLHEVAPGRTLPTVGRVEAIERRGKIWVVVTAKGVIAPPAHWR